MSLESIIERITSCENCPLHKTRTHVVPGEGPKNARVMLIGEAPGADEDRLGRPFVGRAGRILDQALDAASLDRSCVYITNVVKCRPPGNRRPSRSEMALCIPYLKEQIQTINPDMICLMGNVPTRALLGIEGVTALRGRIHQNRYLVTFHPAAVVRNRNLLDLLVSDLKILSGK